MYIRGFNSQGDLRKYLCRLEDSLTKSKFFQKLLELQKEDPKYFYCRAITIGEDKFAFVVGEHPDKRSGIRGNYNPRQIRERCVTLLENPFVGAAIIAHSICINDEGNEVVSWNDHDFMATAVVDEESGLIFIFEAGFQYVRLVTIWSVTSGVFFMHPDTTAIKVSKNGFLENNLENIPEIRMADKPPKNKRQTHI